MELLNLIQQLNDDAFKLLAKGLFFNRLDREAFQTKWMAYSPASVESIARKELQLKTTLPQSYKDFLLTTNGFHQISPFIDALYPVEKIDWAINTEDQEWIKGMEDDSIEVADDDYSNYNSSSQRPELFRPEYFRRSLKISDWDDARCLFLNPVIKHEGEWEVLFYATWLPGTRRFRSFREYLLDTHERNLSLLNGEEKNRS